MLFVAVFLFILSAIFLFFGYRNSNSDMTKMGVIFLIAAVGAGAITYFALSSF